MIALPTKTHSGFTLVELVIVLVLIGILAATAAPKILGRSSTDASTTRDQIISVLRLLQLRAMQKTDLTSCRQVLITATSAGLSDPATCSPATIDNSDQFVVNSTSQLGISVFNQVSGGAQLLPPANEFRFLFSIKGQPLQDSTGVPYPDGLRIEISAGDTYDICIEDEGYIHPC
jgi:MSHA pilin protein MshC